MTVSIMRAHPRRKGAFVSEDAELLHGSARHFMVPPVSDPAAFCRERFDTYKGDTHGEHGIKFSKGTTTLAFLFQGGVIVSVDSRATVGAVIASQEVKKVIEINPYLLGTMAGGAADCTHWLRQLGVKCRLYELKHKERMSVAGASKALVDMLIPYKGYGLSVYTMIAGWDATGPQLYSVDSDGTRLHASESMPYFCIGSGSTFAYGVLDSWHDMTDEEAIELGKRAIYHATHRDAMSGGINNLYIVKPDGWRKVSSIDVDTMGPF